MAHTTQNQGFLFYLKRIFGLILLLAMAAVFLFSGWSKLVSFEAFQWTFMDLGISSTTAAALIAYLFIGLEFALALFLLLHIYLNRVTYPLTLSLLVALTAYLVFLLMQYGNTGNCGCFGDWIYMKPMEAIWKNIAMMAATVLLMYIYPVKPYRHQEWIAVAAGMAAVVTPFIVEPMNVNNEPKMVNREIDLAPLYVQGAAKPGVDLRHGKHVVAFMSLTCPHCRKAAYFLNVLKANHPDLPIYMILSGDPDNFKSFFEESRAYAVPNILFDDKDAFIQMAGEYVPAIYWVNNSMIEYEASYTQLDPQGIKKWLKQ